MPPPINYVATITVDDTKAKGSQISVDPPTIETAPDLHVVFVVRNVGNDTHKVSIDRDLFQKKPGSPPNAPDTPITFFGKHFDHVDAGDVGAIILRMKNKRDYGGDPTGTRYPYKYTIEASGLDDYDPDIGINN